MRNALAQILPLTFFLFWKWHTRTPSLQLLVVKGHVATQFTSLVAATKEESAHHCNQMESYPRCIYLSFNFVDYMRRCPGRDIIYVLT